MIDDGFSERLRKNDERSTLTQNNIRNFHGDFMKIRIGGFGDNYDKIFPDWKPAEAGTYRFDEETKKWVKVK